MPEIPKPKYKPPSWDLKVRAILNLPTSQGAMWPVDRIAKAIAKDYPPDRKAWDIAFHLCDWNREAAFLVAVALRPNDFTAREIREAVMACLIHIPNHVAAAATLGQWPMKDIFRVGAKIDQETDEQKVRRRGRKAR